MRIGYSLPFLLFALPAIFFYMVEDFRELAPVIGYWQLVFLSISIALLPPIFITTCKAFYKLLTITKEPAHEYAEPTWGVYNPWSYLERQSLSWGIVSTILFLSLLLLGMFNFGDLTQGIVAVSVLSLVTGPLNAIMQEERNKPYRWAMSPYVSKIEQAIWLKLNLPLFVIGAAIIFYIGTIHIWWIVSVLIILIVGLFLPMSHTMHKFPAMQSVIYFLLLICCFVSKLMW